MLLYTSNYARNGDKSNAYAISVKPPEWYTGRCLPLLAPTWELVMGIKNGTLSREDYNQRYFDLIDQRNKDKKIINIITKLPEKSFLLCYETSTETCHRHLLGSWIMNHTTIMVKEWLNEREQLEQTKQRHVESLLEF